MAKTSKKNEVAVADQFTKDNIPLMLEQINAKIAELKGGQTKTASTKGISLGQFGRLEDINDVSQLILAYATIESRMEKYAGVVDKLGLTKAPEFQEGGVDGPTWLSDIQARIAQVTHKDTLERLENAKALLEKNLSAEQQFANDMAKFAAIFTEE